MQKIYKQKRNNLNLIVLTDGSVIQAQTFKKSKIFEVFKDNYDITYLNSIQNQHNKSLSNDDLINIFFKKYKS